MAYKKVVTAQERRRVKKFLDAVSGAKGDFFLAMLAQSSPEISNRWTLVVSAPWIDSAGTGPAVSYLSGMLPRYLDNATLSTIDRISPIPSDHGIVTRIVNFLGLRVSLEEPELHIQDLGIVEETRVPEAFIFVANPPVRKNRGGSLRHADHAIR